jgi:hypothetical protein
MVLALTVPLAACGSEVLRPDASVIGSEDLDRPYPAHAGVVSAKSVPNAVFRTVPGASADGVVRGRFPLTVEFNNCQSRPVNEDDNLRFSYDFDGDGTVDEFGHCRWEHTYRVEKNAEVCVSDRRSEGKVCQTWRIAPADEVTTEVTGPRVSALSGNVTLCDLGRTGTTCGTSSDPSMAYFMDFDSGGKVQPTAPAADLSKGHGSGGGSTCCDWYAKNGAALVNTGVPVAQFSTVTCGPGDGRNYATTTIPYGAPNTSVICLRTAEGAYVKYTGRTNCCADIVIDWQRFETN